MTAAAVRTMYRTHPDRPPHTDVVSRCIEACFDCVQACSTCADACLSERNLTNLVTCIRLDLDCAAACAATGSIVTRANKAGNRQPLEAQLTTCIAFCRACARECSNHAAMHKHCKVCMDACNACIEACDAMLNSLRMPA